MKFFVLFQCVIWTLAFAINLVIAIRFNRLSAALLAIGSAGFLWLNVQRLKDLKHL